MYQQLILLLQINIAEYQKFNSERHILYFKFYRSKLLNLKIYIQNYKSCILQIIMYIKNTPL